MAVTAGFRIFRLRGVGIRVHLVRGALIAVTAGAIFWTGRRQPADSSSPMVLHGRAEVSRIHGRRFRVAGFNIRRSKGTDGVRNPGRTADALRRVKPDMAGLFEVDGRLWGGARDQAADLAGELGMSAVFAPTERRFWHDDFGNALLSRVAFDPVHRIPLHCSQRRKYRGALLTRFRVDQTWVNFLAVHIDRVADREHQLKQVFALFHALKAPAVLVGDLNAQDDDPLLLELLSQGDSSNALLSCRDQWPPRRVDWILTRGLTVLNSGCMDDGTSDHPLMWADLELPDQPGTAKR